MKLKGRSRILARLGVNTAASILAFVALLPAYAEKLDPSEITPASAAAAETQVRRRYVNSLEDFFDHVISHVERTVELAAELKRLHPELYSDVDGPLLRIFMNRHDFAKVEVDEKAQKRPFLEGLYRQYGRDFQSFSEHDKALVKRYKDMLNERDAHHARNFFLAFNKDARFIDRHGNYTALAKKYLQIEGVADKVDRGLSPVSAEEFNRKKMALASVFISDPQEQRLALSLEQPGVYDRVTKKHTFEEYRMRRTRREGLAKTCLLDTLLRKIIADGHALPAQGLGR